MEARERGAGVNASAALYGGDMNAFQAFAEAERQVRAKRMEAAFDRIERKQSVSPRFPDGSPGAEWPRSE